MDHSYQLIPVSHNKGHTKINFKINEKKIFLKQATHTHTCQDASVMSNSAWTVAHQVPLSMGFFRQKYWNGLPCPLPGALPNPETELESLMSPELAWRFFTTSTTWEYPLPPHQHMPGLYSHVSYPKIPVMLPFKILLYLSVSSLFLAFTAVTAFYFVLPVSVL